MSIDVKVENFYCIQQDRPPTLPRCEYIMVHAEWKFFHQHARSVALSAIFDQHRNGVQHSVQDSINETRRKFRCKKVGLDRTIYPKCDFGTEKDGLARRLKDARDSASVYVGSEASEYLDREESVEKELSASEQVLVSAAQRVRQLNAQLEHLHRVLDVLKQK
jgi:hypothetical protein